MKHITMILVATLTLAVLASAYNRIPVNLITSAPQNNTAAPLSATPQDAQKAIQKGILSRIASTANKALQNYPSPSQIAKVADPKRRSLLEHGRRLLEAGKSASTWNATQLSNYANQVDPYIKEVEAITKAKPQGPSTQTQQESCGAAKQRCYDRCHDSDGGYFCFFDCRLEYAACLIRGGGAVIQ